MKTYFVRHNNKISIDEATRQRLWDERRIAIHFGKYAPGTEDADCASTNPEDYNKGSGRNCLKLLVELAAEGGYVCAYHYPHTEWMLGFVKPGSTIEVFLGKWGDKARTAALKSLCLTNVKFIAPLKRAILQVARPQQGTIRRWPSAGNRIENLVEGKEVEPTLENLSSAQQETLCSEFLRLPQAEKFGLPRLAHLALPPGRSMPDIDILGVATDGKQLLAQVTHYPLSAVGDKLERLEQ